MPPKKGPGERAKKRQAITLGDKLAMIRRHDRGEKVVAIARSFGVSRTTVSTIVHNKDNILTHITSEAPGMKNTVIKKKRGKIFEEMENLLSVWIDEQHRQNAALCQKIFQEKALSLFEELKGKYPNEKDVEFKASQGWFMRFKNRRSYYFLRKQGESASADQDAAAKFPATSKIVGENERQNKQEQVEPEPDSRHFTIKKMQQAFARIEKGLSMFEDMDPNAQRFFKIMGACHEAFAPYNVILDEKKRTVQDTLDQFFEHIERQQELTESADVEIDDPRPSTSKI